MIYYLRDKNNRTVFELEFWVKTDYETGEPYTYHEISGHICVLPYTNFVVNNIEKSDEIGILFDTLSELRGWLWETYYMVDSNVGDEKDTKKINNYLTAIFTEVARKYNGLSFVTD